MTARRALAALVLGALVAACAQKPDPARKKAVSRLTDGRSTVRIQALRELAPKADRAEATAMARAAHDAPVEVRREVAVALGKAPAAEAVDLLGALLRDPSDAVRAAAVEALGQKADPKARPYIASAYVRGAPLTRAAVVQAGPAALQPAIAAEAKARELELTRRMGGTTDALRASGLQLLGISGTPQAIERIAAQLQDPSPVVLSAAAQGLARAHAKDKVPLLLERLQKATSAQAAALAPALGTLGGAGVAEALAKRLPTAEPDEALALLDALSRLPESAEAKGAACQLAAATDDPSVAVQAARYVGGACAAAVAPGEAGGMRLFALAAARVCEPKSVLSARKTVADTTLDASTLSAAATYLGVCGETKDGPALAALALNELQELVAHKVARHAMGDLRKAEVRAEAAEHDEAMREMYRLNGQEAELDKLPKPLGDKLSQLLVQRSARGSESFEHRPGARMLIAAATASAARQGGDLQQLGEALLSDDDPRVRLVAAEAVDLAGDRASALRAKIEADPDTAVKRLLALRDLQARREGALARLTALADGAAADEQMAMAEALQPVATEAKALLLKLADEEDPNVAAAAARSLELVSGADVEETLGRRLLDPHASVALAALGSLRTRPGDQIDALLVRAAAHPEGEVRAAALGALAGRKACSNAARLAPFSGDFDGLVREAARSLAAACPTSP